jgi:hypothetical protein
MPGLVPRREASIGELDRIELAPFAQGAFRGFRFEIVPALEHISSDQQRSKFLVGATLAEDVSDLVEIIGQEFARKIQCQWFAEIEVTLARDRSLERRPAMSGDTIVAAIAPNRIALRGRKVVGGYAEGEAIVTRDTISGWGGINEREGTAWKFPCS